MPKPRKGERKKKYISRAISAFRHEGYKQKTAIGRAYGFFDYYSKKKGKNKSKHKPKKRR